MLLALAHGRPHLLRIPTWIGDWLKRSQNSRPGKNPARDRIAQVFVLQRSRTLNGGEASVQSGHGVFGDVPICLGRRFISCAVAIVVVEVICKMRVSIDPARRYR